MAEISYREALNQALREEMDRDERVFIMGEEVGYFGGAFKVTDGLLADDVARIDRDTAAADRDIALHSVMLRQVEQCARPRAEHWKRHLADRPGVADAAITDKAGHAALHQPGYQDLPGAGRSCIAAAVDHQHVALRCDLDRLALGMFGIGEHRDIVQVLARRDVPQGECGTDQVAVIMAQRPDTLHERVAQPTLEQLRGQGCGACEVQPLGCGTVK